MGKRRKGEGRVGLRTCAESWLLATIFLILIIPPDSDDFSSGVFEVSVHISVSALYLLLAIISWFRSVH